MEYRALPLPEYDVEVHADAQGDREYSEGHREVHPSALHEVPPRVSGAFLRFAIPLPRANLNCERHLGISARACAAASGTSCATPTTLFRKGRCEHALEPGSERALALRSV